MANEVYFPPEIFENIQSFFNARDEARLSVLSKSWYISYPKRPELVFDENNPIFRSHDFSEFCTETLNLLKTRKLMLDKFTLLMKIGKELGWGMTAYDLRNKLASKLITSALELGVCEIELKLNDYSDFDLRCDLPAQIFASTSLLRLSVDRCVIDGVIGERVRCSLLKSLVLHNVKTTDDIVRNILARCPLIENLDLRKCVGVEKLNVSKQINLVEFRVASGVMVSVEFMDFDRMNVTEFRCLRRLHLEKVNIGAEFFTTRFGSLFPCVEHLTLEYCGTDYDKINISSHSIKRLSLYQGERFKKVQLNVPNISKFVFRVGCGDIHTRNRFKPLPSLSFNNVPKDWESDVQLLWGCDVIRACWFKDLRKFLNRLNLSKIDLQVIFTGESVVIPNPGEEIIPCLLPLVENLKVSTSSAYITDSLLDGLFKSCDFNNLIA